MTSGARDFGFKASPKQSNGFVRNTSKIETIRFKIHICFGEAQQTKA